MWPPLTSLPLRNSRLSSRRKATSSPCPAASASAIFTFRRTSAARMPRPTRPRPFPRSPASPKTRSRPLARRPVHVPGLLRRPRARRHCEGVRSAVYRCLGEAETRFVAGAGRVRLWLAPDLHRYRHPRAHPSVRGDGTGCENRLARRTKETSVAEGLYRDASQIHGAAARSSRKGGRADFGSAAEETSTCALRRGTAVTCFRARFAWLAACLLLAVSVASAHESRPAFRSQGNLRR